MLRTTVTCRTVVIAAVLSCPPAAPAALVDMRLTPIDQAVCVAELVEIDLVLVSDGAPQSFDAADAVLSWDPALLHLLGADDFNAEVAFFVADFLPDPDGVNADIEDGDAIYTVWVQPGEVADAPSAPDELLVTTFQFEVVGDQGPAEVALLPTIGTFGLSRVLLAGSNITGALGEAAEVNFSCLADVTVDGVVGPADLALLLGSWGSCSSAQDCCPDFNGDGNVNAFDLAALLGSWGPCP